MTALHRAIITENFARVQTLLDMGAGKEIEGGGVYCLPSLLIIIPYWSTVVHFYVYYHHEYMYTIICLSLLT